MDFFTANEALCRSFEECCHSAVDWYHHYRIFGRIYRQIKLVFEKIVFLRGLVATVQASNWLLLRILVVLESFFFKTFEKLFCSRL